MIVFGSAISKIGILNAQNNIVFNISKAKDSIIKDMYGHFAEGPGLCIYGRFYVGIADNILQRSDYKKIRKNRYAFFDTGKGKEFVDGQLSLENLRNFAMENGEPSVKSGKQEYLENIINNFI